MAKWPFRALISIVNTEAYDDESKTASEWFVSFDVLEDAMPFFIAPDDKTLLEVYHPLLLSILDAHSKSHSVEVLSPFRVAGDT